MTLKDLESQLLALTPAEKERVIQLLTQSLASIQPTIAQPPEISNGEARIANTQIAIWELVNAQDLEIYSKCIPSLQKMILPLLGIMRMLILKRLCWLYKRSTNDQF
jgi:hypothetical protein